MAGVPTIPPLALGSVTALASIAPAFTTWDGTGFDSIKCDMTWITIWVPRAGHARS